MTDHAQAIVNAANESVRDAKQFTGSVDHQAKIFLQVFSGRLSILGRAGNDAAKALDKKIWCELLENH